MYQFKYHNKRRYGQVFAKELAEQFGNQIKKWGIEAVIPVPLHPARRRKRGYNQAEILAGELGRIMSLSVDTDAVVRLRNTKAQKQLDDREREQNLMGAFGVRSDWKKVPKVLLVDDIYTTGNTIHRVAKVLKKAGVEKVYFLTISIGQGL